MKERPLLMKKINRYDITKEHIIAFHTLIICSFHGMYEARSNDSLDAVLEMYNSTSSANGNTVSRASALIYAIVRFHPFLDAKKRTAIISCATYLLMNGFVLEANDDDLLQIRCEIENGSISREELREWMMERVVPIADESVTASNIHAVI